MQKAGGPAHALCPGGGDATMATREGGARSLVPSPTLRRIGTALLLLLVGVFDYFTGPEIAAAPFYVAVLLIVAVLEAWWICLAYSGMAAAFLLTADLLRMPGSVTLIYPYWRAAAHFLSFALISATVSQLLAERRRLRHSELVLQEKTEALAETNRTLEETLREVQRLQDNLLTTERQAAVAETIYAATYEMERPLVSLSIYMDELLRKVGKDEEIAPILEKLGETVGNMERVLREIRACRSAWAGPRAAERAGGQGQN